VILNIIRALTKLCVVIAITACLPIAAAHAQAATFAYVSATGGGNCTSPTQPCTNFNAAINAAMTNGNGQVVCLSSVNLSLYSEGTAFTHPNQTFKMDCPAGAYLTALSWSNVATNVVAKLRNVVFTNGGPAGAVQFLGSGTLILEDCVAEEGTTTLIDIEPNGPLTLVIRNCRISSSASAILLKPTFGGSINATFDHVTIAGNSGGGLKIDASNGPVTADLIDSVVANNGGNGVNVVGGGSSQGMLNIKSSVIAKNGAAGVQANGANAGVLMQTTLLDQNAAGALSIVNSGHISTYGNNSITGSAGSGFTGGASLQ
jgi:hypothetical protein